MRDLKVLVSDGFAFANDQISIAIVYSGTNGTKSVLEVNDDGSTSWRDHAEFSTVTTPTITIGNDIARALLEALSRHYSGTTDVRTAREDLLHERGRVDKMIEALIGMSYEGSIP